MEVLVRVFHLYADDPPKMIDEFGVEKRVPGSKGYYVTGNRRQNFSEYAINDSGFNSFREFSPTKDTYEIALIGDSFIEGFHQDYSESLGKKIEELMPKIQVFEYGYTGSSMAYQMHLVDAYKEKLIDVDKIILYMKFKNDFNSSQHRADYALIEKLNTPLFQIRKECKLWVYGSRHGLVAPIKKVASGIFYRINYWRDRREVDKQPYKLKKVNERIDNFQKLIDTYGFNKEKTVLLLDSRTTNSEFLDYCKKKGIDFIDYSKGFKSAQKPVTLIYDMHWNDYGRGLIAQDIVDYLKNDTKSHKASSALNHSVRDN